MALKIHHLRPAPSASTAKTRVDRGETSKGKAVGRGTEDTDARKNVLVNFESDQMPIHMRIPKLRGFKNPLRAEYQVVNVDRLAKLFPRRGVVAVEDLVEAGAVRGGALVKVLDDGDINVALNATADAFSNSAKEKLAAIGSSVAEA